ncbi:hypothetical protein INR49_014975 [Caranx melampygus]|nr:hypothetical protein INR49_014975 [Caranx melampygus]
MKPPPRTRNKPDRSVEPGTPRQRSDNPVRQWGTPEQKKLLTGLKRLGKTAGKDREIDYAHLQKLLPSRSIPEIQAFVEALKNEVISSVSMKLKRMRREERKSRKPIQVWTHMASAVAGKLEEPITRAFSQMLMVSSTEPCTLRNCDPPQIYRPPSDPDRPVGRTIPLRPMPRVPIQAGQRAAINPTRPLLIVKTPAPIIAKGLPALTSEIRAPISKLPPPQQQQSVTAGSSPAAPSQPGVAEIPAAAPAAPQPPATPASAQTALSTDSAAAVVETAHQQPPASAVMPAPLSPRTAVPSSGDSITPVPEAAPSSVHPVGSSSSSTLPVPSLSTCAAAVHARFGRTSKYATKDSPRTLGVKCIVDFERIYCYLSKIHKPTDDCCLTPMESAIVLDLLMSLTEELPLLDCKSLRKHLVQVYRSLSSPADSQRATELLKNLKDAISTQSGGESAPDSARAEGQQSSDTPDSSEVVDSGGEQLQPEAEDQSSKSNNTSSQAGKGDAAGLPLCPPLNPFMVPLKLLKRR